MTGNNSRDHSTNQSQRDPDVLSNTSTTTHPPHLSINWLRETFPKYENQVTHHAEMPAKTATTVPAENVLPAELATKLDHGLYTHQAKALKHLRNGDNVCAATSTASGKTWIYTLYFATLKQQNPYARGLFLYPTKALSNDQEKAVSELLNKLGINATVKTYDGDTNSEAKRDIRKNADIIITNFSALNHYLPHHHKWRRLYSNLELVVTDESHNYTGILGMHASWIIRRLKRVISEYGSYPQYICSTATIGNPKEHSNRLLDEDFTVISNDGSPRGKRDIGIWAPPAVQNPLDESQRSATTEIAEISTHLAKSGVQTLCFVRSRQGVEVAAKRAETAASNHPTDTPITVAPYHAGLSKHRRKQLEQQIQAGKIDCVFSTSALELGIDIGGIDATVVGGYPGTRQSFWQQIGRAGRGNDESLSVFVTKESAMDQYINSHPGYLLEDDVEDAVISLSNNTVYARHILCAAEELPLTSDDIDLLGSEPRLRSAVSLWDDAGKLAGSLDSRVQYTGPPRPQSTISIYGTGNEEFDVECVGDDDISLESVNKERAYREFHPGALFMHDGLQYEVLELHEDRPRQYIEVEQVHVNERTITRHDKTVRDVEENRRIDLGEGYSLHAGMATIDINYYEYVRVPIYEDGDTGESLPKPITLDPVSIRTAVMWVELPDDMQHQVMNHIDASDMIDPSDSSTEHAMQTPDEWTFCGGLHGAEHGMIKLSPLELRIDNSDIGGLSTPLHPETECPTWFIHDGIDGGIGFAHSIYENFTDIAEKTRERVSECSCSDPTGCPSCLMSDQCGNDNEPLHKIATQLILDAVLQRMDATHA